MMGLAIDPASGLARLGAGGGGLSGPALHPIAVRAVFECRRAFPTTAIVGVGGVSTGHDAAELLSAGANAVQVGTASFVDPRAPVRVQAELADWCAANGYRSVSQVVGLAQRGLAPPDPASPAPASQEGGPASQEGGPASQEGGTWSADDVPTSRPGP
jgi:dihydroorotate dehydrogenase (NAD+) catalytic subunit